MDIKRYLREKKEMIDSALTENFPREGDCHCPPSLYRAMQYSLFAGGKRIRPILAVAAFEAAGGKGDIILPFACALEMIHTYSLIHDDLPAMDNDDYRRGKLTCHKVFGEGVAILAGDGLLTEAFRLMAHALKQRDRSFDFQVGLELIDEVAEGAGITGMVGGQVVDIESEGKEVDFPTVQYIHVRKTGAMILASVRVGAILGGAKGETLEPFTRFGKNAGLAFQIADDILNVEGSPELLGKSVGSDLSKKKATYPALLGVEESKRRAKELVEAAVDALGTLGPEADPLREIARFIVARDY